MEEFKDILNSIKENIRKELGGRDGWSFLYQFLKYASKLEGEIAEVGVFAGATAKILAKACSDKPIHLFDTFKGMPAEMISSIDKYGSGETGCPFEIAQNSLKEYSNICFHPGVFPSTAESIKDKEFCFIHCDADLYKTTLSCLNFFYNRMIKGGIMLFRNYKFLACCPGTEEAIDGFLVDKPEYPIELIAGHYCLIIKI